MASRLSIVFRGEFFRCMCAADGVLLEWLEFPRFQQLPKSWKSVSLE